MSVIENIKKSKRNYGDKYNKVNINVQLNRDLINKLKSRLNNETSIKSFIETLIMNEIG